MPAGWLKFHNNVHFLKRLNYKRTSHITYEPHILQYKNSHLIVSKIFHSLKGNFTLPLASWQKFSREENLSLGLRNYIFTNCSQNDVTMDKHYRNWGLVSAWEKKYFPLSSNDKLLYLKQFYKTKRNPFSQKLKFSKPGQIPALWKTLKILNVILVVPVSFG